MQARQPALSSSDRAPNCLYDEDLLHVSSVVACSLSEAQIGGQRTNLECAAAAALWIRTAHPPRAIQSGAIAPHSIAIHDGDRFIFAVPAPRNHHVLQAKIN